MQIVRILALDGRHQPRQASGLRDLLASPRSIMVGEDHPVPTDPLGDILQVAGREADQHRILPVHGLQPLQHRQPSGIAFDQPSPVGSLRPEPEHGALGTATGHELLLPILRDHLKGDDLLALEVAHRDQQVAVQNQSCGLWEAFLGQVGMTTQLGIGKRQSGFFGGLSVLPVLLPLGGVHVLDLALTDSSRPVFPPRGEAFHRRPVLDHTPPAIEQVRPVFLARLVDGRYPVPLPILIQSVDDQAIALCKVEEVHHALLVMRLRYAIRFARTLFLTSFLGKIAASVEYLFCGQTP